jgi:hypothetical protein
MATAGINNAAWIGVKTGMGRSPKIRSVHPNPDLQLLIEFENGEERTYDCRTLLSRPGYGLLAIPGFFKYVKVDPGGYCVYWNDEVDISEYELWTNGRVTPEKTGER